VPTKDSAATLEDCLVSIRRQTIPCTLVVVDNGSRDSTLSIARAFADLVLESGPERSAQRNAGARSTSESLIGFIDSDMVLDPRVVEGALDAFHRGAATVVVPEVTIGNGFWARVSAYERSFYVNNEVIEAPRFFTRACFEDVGGFDEAMTGAEDWDLGLRTLDAGPRLRTTAVISHNEGNVHYFEICRKKGYYAKGVALFMRKHGTQALLPLAARSWLRSPRALANPLGVGLVILKLGQGAAMAIALTRLSFGHPLALASRSNLKRKNRQDAP